MKNSSDLYKIYSKKKVLEALKQFVIFIDETGLSDTHENNYKFMADGSGIALYDLEFMNEPSEHGLEFLMNGLPDWTLYDNLKGLIKVYNFQAYDKIWPSQALVEVK